MTKHCIFDFDGTLISSMEVVVWGVKEVLTEYLGREVSETELVQKFDADIGVTFDAYNIHDHQDRHRLIERWREVTMKSKLPYPLFDGVREMLHNLMDQGYHLHIWTARDRKSTIAILESHNILNFFKNIWTSTDGPIKPHPYGIKKMLGKELKSPSKHRIIMVGDSHMDVWAAKNANIPVVGVYWCPISSQENLIKQGATFVTNSVRDCETVIHKYLNKNVKGNIKNV